MSTPRPVSLSGRPRPVRTLAALTAGALGSAGVGLAAVVGAAAPAEAAPAGGAPLVQVQDDLPRQLTAALPAPVVEAVTELTASGTPGVPVGVAVLDPATGRPDITHVVAVDPAAAEQVVDHLSTVPGVVAAVDTRVSVAGGDPYSGSQWPINRLAGDRLATAGATGAGQVVAVVDTGVQSDHPDLAGNVLPGYDELTHSAGPSSDPNGHGTHVAGIIAALRGNGIGVAGLAPGAKVLPIRAMAADGTGLSSDVAAGIVWAVDHGATIVNLSLAGDAPDALTAQAVDYAEANRVLVVAAAGNDHDEGNPVKYPAALDDVLAVGATTATDARATFSETGSYVDLTAPGDAVLSTYAASAFAVASGTSMAAPYAAAAAALLRAREPALTPAQVRAALAATADDLGAPGRDDEFGAGLVDPAAALGIAAGPTAQPAADLAGPRSTPGPAVVPVAPTDSAGSAVGGHGNRYLLAGAGNDSGTARAQVTFGDPQDVVYFGDWDGDGVDTPMVRRGNVFFVQDQLDQSPVDAVFTYGDPGDVVLVGDWDGDGRDTLTIRRGNRYFVKNDTTTGIADEVQLYGDAGDAVLVGDWDGDGRDTLTIRRGNRYLVKNDLRSGVAEFTFTFGDPGDSVLVGDWARGAMVANGVDQLAVRRGNVYHFSAEIVPGAQDGPGTATVGAYGEVSDTAFVAALGGGRRGDGLGVRR